VALLLAACDTSRAPVGADAGPGDSSDVGADPDTRYHDCLLPEQGPDLPGTGQCPCTDPKKCAEPWTCDSNKTCTRAAPTPNSQAGWTCTWYSPMRYWCTSTSASPFPPGSAVKDWYCGFRQSTKLFECLRATTPHPCSEQTTDAAWSCQVKGATLQCHWIGTPRVTSPKWSCWTEGTRKLCKVTDTDRGLPPTGTSWRCHRPRREGHLQWRCHGTSATTPSGAGWTCAKEGDTASLYRCEKMLTTHDLPTGEGYWVTAKGSVYGTQAEQMVPGKPVSTSYPCKTGHRMWCDGLQYGGWGHVRCINGKWETKVVNGKQVLDCKEQSGGQRPDTRCACYHFFLNTDCCERPDCVLPSGGAGRVCPKSAGALCDHCNPQKPECVGDQAKCIVTSAHETFCGRLCSDAKPCPSGYHCMIIYLKVGNTKQCVPADLSCYY